MVKKNGFFFKRGFSLIEVLVVVGIISFLSVLVTSYFRSQIFRANDSRRKAELKRIAQALEEYEKDFSCYPNSASVVCTSGGIGLRPYLEKIPCDPTFDTSYAYQDDGTACSKWYRLYSKLENTKDPDYQIGIGPGGTYNFSFTSPNAP